MSDGIIEFTPVEYDAENIPPDAPEGAWNATLSVKVSKTKIKEDSSGGYPMLICDWTLDQALTDGNESFEGASVSDFIVFFPPNSRALKMSKVRLRDFADKLHVSRSLIPKRIASSADLEEFVAAIDGQTTNLWTVHEKDKTTGEIRCKPSYTEPGAKSALAPLAPLEGEETGEEEAEEEDDEEALEAARVAEEEAAAAAALAAKAKGTKGKTKANGRPAARA